MWNARLDEAQAEIKIARRNIKNLRYADDTTHMMESKEELKSLLMKVQEESEKDGLKHNIHPFPAVSTSSQEHASRKGSSSSLSRREEETQEEAPGAEPQFLFHGCKMPRML